MDAFAEATAKFSHWLKAVGHVAVSPKIGIDDKRDVNEGRCVVTTDEILQGEVIFEIPRQSILNVATSKLVENYPEIQEMLLKKLDHWDGLVLCLLYEMKVLGDKSKWWEYFLVLPKQDSIQMLMFWSDEELELLRPSMIVERVGKSDARDMFDRINGYVKGFAGQFAEELGQIKWDDFLYVASVIMSYSFDVENAITEQEELHEENQSLSVEKDGYMKSMIPLADTLNADTKKCNANLTYDVKALKMLATDDIKKGSQVYNIYGEHPNAELLRRYGYVEWDGSKYDFAEIPITLILQKIIQYFNVHEDLIDSLLEIMKEKAPFFELFEGEEVIVDSYDCYKDGQLPLEGVLLIQILCLYLQKANSNTFKDSQKEKELYAVAIKSVELIKSNRVTRKCVELWQLCIEERLNEYPTHAFREACPNHDSFSDVGALRQMMADKVLQSEVESLQNCLFALDLEFRTMNDSTALESIQKRKRAQKKQKFVKKPKN